MRLLIGSVGKNRADGAGRPSRTGELLIPIGRAQKEGAIPPILVDEARFEILSTEVVMEVYAAGPLKTGQQVLTRITIDGELSVGIDLDPVTVGDPSLHFSVAGASAATHIKWSGEFNGRVMALPEGGTPPTALAKNLDPIWVTVNFHSTRSAADSAKCLLLTPFTLIIDAAWFLVLGLGNTW